MWKVGSSKYLVTTSLLTPVALIKVLALYILPFWSLTLYISPSFLISTTSVFSFKKTPLSIAFSINETVNENGETIPASLQYNEPTIFLLIFGSRAMVRSEERRVGKECRSRWS